MYSRESSTARGYDARWREARSIYLRSHPICVYCRKYDRVTPATVVDHITPHKGDKSLFWDRDNWQALCKRCHDSDKQREERGKVVTQIDEQGNPIGLEHW